MRKITSKTQTMELLKELETLGFIASEWIKTSTDNSFTKYWRLTR